MLTFFKTLGRGVLDVVAPHRAFITLLLLASAAGFIYVEFARMRSARDGFARWIDVGCAAAGSAWATTKDAPKNTRPGDQCAGRIVVLAAFEHDAAIASANALADAMKEHDGKTNADSASARRAAEQARDAATRMEKANAEVQGDRVTGAWFDALNRTGGLRAPAD